MRYKVLTPTRDGFAGANTVYESIDGALAQIHSALGWLSLGELHAALRKWAETAEPGVIFSAGPSIVLVVADAPEPPPQPYTPKEFATEMDSIFTGRQDKHNDPESEHARADALLCEQLRRLGYDAGVEIFEKAKKWYA